MEDMIWVLAFLMLPLIIVFVALICLFPGAGW